MLVVLLVVLFSNSPSLPETIIPFVLFIVPAALMMSEAAACGFLWGYKHSV